MSHPVLAQMERQLAFEEVFQSKLQLETALRTPVWAFAFPFGNPGTVTLRERELAEEAGFKYAFLSMEHGSPTERFAIPRIHVSLDTTLSELDAHLSGFYRSVRDKFVEAPATA